VYKRHREKRAQARDVASAPLFANQQNCGAQ
jgi:hypothetical protein